MSVVEPIYLSFSGLGQLDCATEILTHLSYPELRKKPAQFARKRDRMRRAIVEIRSTDKTWAPPANALSDEIKNIPQVEIGFVKRRLGAKLRHADLAGSLACPINLNGNFYVQKPMPKGLIKKQRSRLTIGRMIAYQQAVNRRDPSNLKKHTWGPHRSHVHLCLTIWRLKNARVIPSAKTADVCEYLLRDRQALMDFLTTAEVLEIQIAKSPGLVSAKQPLVQLRLAA